MRQVVQPLDGDQIRQLVNVEQLYDAYRSAQQERDQRFRGAMTWKTVADRQYLYQKVDGADWKSLGPRSAKTEYIRERFVAGRQAVRDRIDSLDQRIRQQAPINRALRLGRVPVVAARVLRRLERQKLLGGPIVVAGTYALFAYERLAGGHFEDSHIATLDIDLLFDARQRLRLVGRNEGSEGGLEELLRKADPSFAPLAPGSFRATNATGFLVDLITPMPPRPGQAKPARIGGDADMTAAEIDGLAWLQYAPRDDVVVIDERGYPLRLVVPDPRAFALHKLWVSERPDRDKTKAKRDRAQAKAVAEIVSRYLPERRFESPELMALPETLRARAPELIRESADQPTVDDADWV